MLKLWKIQLAFAVSLLLSLSLFTAGAFAAHVGMHAAGQSTLMPPTNITSAFTSTTEDATGQTQQFKAGTKMNIVVNLAGQQGYMRNYTYVNGEFMGSPIYTIPRGLDGARIEITPIHGVHVHKLYWYTKADCSDATLAQTVSFSAV